MRNVDVEFIQSQPDAYTATKRKPGVRNVTGPL